MSQDIIIDNIIMTILFILVLKKKLFVNTNNIHSVESFLLWNSYTTFFLPFFYVIYNY